MHRLLLLPLVIICLWFAPAGPATASQAQVTDAATGTGIPGATIVIGNQLITTGATGNFQFQAATGVLFARAPGYRAESVDVTKIPASGAKLSLPPFVPQAVYLSVYGIGSTKLRQAALALVQAGTVNTLVIDIKGDSGLVPYPSAVPLVQQDGARRITTIPDLAALVQMLHQKGIYVIARIVTFKDEPLATYRPDLAVHLSDGTLFRDRQHLAWTDPFQPEVQNYNIAIAVEAAHAGFDEVQFDYLRFPDASQQLKFAGPTNEQQRVAAISGFLAEARRQLLPYNVYLSADFFGYVCWNHNDTGIGQNLNALEANVDYLSPMLYPSGFQFGIPGYTDPINHSYQIVYQSLAQAQLRLNISPKRFRPWLQAFADYAFDHRSFDANEVASQIKATTDFGSDGWMLWNPRNNYDNTGLANATAQAGDMKVAALSSLACY
jgi:hypothetical protein